MQRLMMADSKANARSGEPQDQMMPTQRDGNVMALFRTATRAGFRFGHVCL
jgi:hypothetical protein